MLSDISEYGSNSNGEYIKYSNGVLVCWNKTTIDTNQTAGGGIFPYFGSKTVTFPVAFNSSPIGFCNTFDNSAYHNSLVTSISTTDITLVRGSNLNYTTANIGWFAIGRWK